MWSVLIVALLLAVALDCGLCTLRMPWPPAASAAPPPPFQVVGTMHHEKESFTQGLLYHDGALFESTGLYGKSEIRRVDPHTGTVISRTKLSRKLFGEGIVVVGDVLFMLTWREKRLLMFNAQSLELIHELTFKSASGPGWGLAYDGEHLICSDGSAVVVFWKVPDIHSRATEEVRRFTVRTRGGVAQDQVNELEYVDGFIYANIWYKDKIIKIDPVTGTIVKHFDMSRLWPHKSRPRSADCLNGIAYNETSRAFLLTGKMWPRYYTVKLNDAAATEL